MTSTAALVFALTTEMAFVLDAGSADADRRSWWHSPPAGTLHTETLRIGEPLVVEPLTGEPLGVEPLGSDPVPGPTSRVGDFGSAGWRAPAWTDGVPAHNEVLRGGVDGMATLGTGGVERVELTTVELEVIHGADGLVERVTVLEARGSQASIDLLVDHAHAQLPGAEGRATRERWVGSVHVLRTSPALGCFIDPIDGIDCGDTRYIELRRAE